MSRPYYYEVHEGLNIVMTILPDAKVFNAAGRKFIQHRNNFLESSRTVRSRVTPISKDVFEMFTTKK